ncbi:MAG TPA: DUF4234 domain-containing protein [Flavobacterium sp.]|jgi:hypothetical protein
MENITQETWNTPQPPIPEFKVDPIMVLILGFVTCGLYLIYWNIKVAEVLNAVAGREVISQPVAIFAGCCYPVNVYFFYVVGKEALPEVYKRTGVVKDDSVLLLILGFFFPMVAAMIVQSDVNRLYR